MTDEPNQVSEDQDFLLDEEMIAIMYAALDGISPVLSHIVHQAAEANCRSKGSPDTKLTENEVAKEQHDGTNRH